MTYNPKSIGLYFKRLRKLKKITQVQIAENLNINYRHYQDIEGGKSNLKIETFNKVLEYFWVATVDNQISKKMSSHEFLTDDFINSKVLKDNQLRDKDDLEQVFKVNKFLVQIIDAELNIHYVTSNVSEFSILSYEEILKGVDVCKLAIKEEREYIKEYLQFLAANRPVPVPYSGKYIIAINESIPIKIFWNYIKDTSHNHLGFMCLICYSI